jgi:hypothetical protein
LKPTTPPVGAPTTPHSRLAKESKRKDASPLSAEAEEEAEFLAVQAAVYLLRLRDVRASRRNVQRVLTAAFGKGLRGHTLGVYMGRSEVTQEPAAFTPPCGWHDGTNMRLPLPGVYAIYEDGKLAYIGSSRNIRGRLDAGHHKLRLCDPKRISIKVRYFKPSSFLWLAVEARFIRRLSPPWNTQGRR